MLVFIVPFFGHSGAEHQHKCIFLLHETAEHQPIVLIVTQYRQFYILLFCNFSLDTGASHKLPVLFSVLSIWSKRRRSLRGAPECCTLPSSLSFNHLGRANTARHLTICSNRFHVYFHYTLQVNPGK